MKCPYCEYDNDEDEYKCEGQFWHLTNKIELERETKYWIPELSSVVGCPSCKRLFVDD